MGLKSSLGEDGRDLWDDWSMRATGKFDEAGQVKWDSFAEPGDDRGGRELVTAGTIYHLAVKNGFPDGPIPPQNGPVSPWNVGLFDDIINEELPPGPEELGFDKIVMVEPSAEVLAALAAAAASRDPIMGEMNARYAFVKDRGGRSMILEETTDAYGKPTVKFRSAYDFEKDELNRKIVIEGPKGEKVKTLAQYWMEHPERRQYKGTVFSPKGERVVNGYLNMWRGFAIEPKPGDWSLMQAHIRDVIAGGNKEHDAYIVKWLAWTLQNPEKPAEVALVVRSGEGTGKGILGNALLEIYGGHGVHLNKPGLLAGRFSGHFENVCYAFSDEAFWAGDQAARGALYTMITEKYLLIERKGIDAFQVENRLKFIIAGNAEWAVPAGKDARRWAVFNVSEAKKDNRAYFNALTKETENGGLEAMLHELLDCDLKGWHPREDVPQTEALMHQKLKSLEPADAWICRLLQTGELPRSDGTKLAKQRRDLDALTKLNRALGEQRPFEDMHGRVHLIGWNERKKDRPRCGARTRASGSCKAPVVRGRPRCRMHGGLSTGPKTSEGKARSAAGVKAYWERWRAARAAREAAAK